MEVRGMAYVVPSDIRLAMRKLPSSISDSEIETYIAKAEAYLNGILGAYFVVPFEVQPLTPPLIKALTGDLTVFFLSEDLYTSQQPNMDEYQEKRWDRIMNMIEAIKTGELDIGVPQKPSTDTTSAGFASTNDSIPTFSLDDPFW